eukprot:gene17370-22918_t
MRIMLGPCYTEDRQTPYKLIKLVMDYFTKKSIVDLDISYNSNGWGPVSGERIPVFGEIPYAHFDKKDKIGRPSDFTQSNQYVKYQQKGYRKDDGNVANAEFAYRHDALEDSTFQLVDNTAKTTRPNKKNWNTGRNQTGGRYGNRPNTGYNKGKTQELQVLFNSGKGPRKTGASEGSFLKGRTGPGKVTRRINKVDRAPSLAVSSDWVIVEEFDLSQLLKLQANAPQVEDLLWSGHLDAYDESFERTSTNKPKTLKKVDNKIFYSVTTKDDPVMENFLVDDVGDIYTTDIILAHLVVAPRSIYSWDIVIEKTDGKIFLDKRESSDFDLLTVSETAQEPPVESEDFDEFNHPGKLSIEATAINQNFSQQILQNKPEKRKKFEPNPFFAEDDEGEPASVAYRYRKFKLGDIRLVVRTELHGWTNRGDQELYFTTYALNEWDSRFSGGMNWRQKLDSQRSAVLGTEIKNNSCKLAKWAAQSVLAGADLMKIGYVSRQAPTNPLEHVILGTQSFKPKEFSTQINLNSINIWGIIKMFCELLSKKEDGKYVLIKDPNKSTVRLYSVPLDTFEAEAIDSDNDNNSGDKDDDDDM